MAKCTDLISREAAKAAIEMRLRNQRDYIAALELRPRCHQSHIDHAAGVLNGLELAAIAIDALPAADAGNLLPPEPLKEALRVSLRGCGPMAIVYAEATVNAMARIESPKAEPKEPGSAGGCNE